MRAILQRLPEVLSLVAQRLTSYCAHSIVGFCESSLEEDAYSYERMLSHTVMNFSFLERAIIIEKHQGEERLL